MHDLIKTNVHPYIDENGEKVLRIRALIGKETVGSLYASYNEQGIAKLESIQVNLGVRGKGIGGIMIQELISIMQMQGVNYITGEMKPEFGIHYKETQNFYEKNGFMVDQDFNLSRRI